MPAIERWPGRRRSKRRAASGCSAWPDAALAGEIDPPLWTLGHIGWFQELWVGRNVQRSRGEEADPGRPRLASILPGADAWYDPAACARPARHALAAASCPMRRRRASTWSSRSRPASTCSTHCPTRATTRSISIASRCSTKRCMSKAFAVLAQSAGLAVPAGLLPRLASRASRPPLLFPATRWLLGVGSPGFRFDNEREPHPVAIPEFEMDAQAVTWAQFGEFVEDGGYDDPSHWSDDRLGLGRARRRGARRAMSTSSGTACCSIASAGWPACRRRSLPCTSAGTRPMPGAAGPAGACPAKPSGRRPRIRVRRAAFVSATSGSGRRALSPLSRLRRRPVARVFAALLRPRQGAARRVVRDPAGAARARAFAGSNRPSATTASSVFAAAPPEVAGGMDRGLNTHRGGASPIRESPSSACAAASNNRPGRAGTAPSSNRRPSWTFLFPSPSTARPSRRRSIRAHCSCSSCARTCS